MKKLARNRKLRALSLIFFALTSTVAACRSDPEPVEVADYEAEDSEPERYSAVVVVAVDDGQMRELSVTRVARLGDLRREEWVESGESRALILRPDLGKSYLLSLDRRLYVETDWSVSAEPGAASVAQSDSAPPLDPAAVEIAADRVAQPLDVKTLALPDQVINDYTCKVIEQRASFEGGHTEVTRSFRADRLNGLALRTERETYGEAGRVRLITERRDLQTEVSPDLFIVPKDFKRVDKLF
ncbi:MAG TPA: hypothetical protein VJQ56_15985 [Blastocatellia bacterium]|nr:hypothetical protein [Blastocatellia bacterium]